MLAALNSQQPSACDKAARDEAAALAVSLRGCEAEIVTARTKPTATDLIQSSRLQETSRAITDVRDTLESASRRFSQFESQTRRSVQSESSDSARNPDFAPSLRTGGLYFA